MHPLLTVDWTHSWLLIAGVSGWDLHAFECSVAELARACSLEPLFQKRFQVEILLCSDKPGWEPRRLEPLTRATVHISIWQSLGLGLRMLLTLFDPFASWLRLGAGGGGSFYTMSVAVVWRTHSELWYMVSFWYQIFLSLTKLISQLSKLKKN